jgi:diaminohydroxyphosphoribosylaminopyrimidine deaminase / 5-amino-6-(5-phosphoribosylamino)uracil reductase
MRFALAEAYRAPRAVRPNPRVGCALETVSGELVSAHHQCLGEAHAERKVLDICNERGLSTQGARLAVTLEPCSHQGRTPPCADALIEAGISEIYVGVEDPFPQVRGSGLKKLREAGVSVHIGVLSEKSELLNRHWLFAHRNERAHLTLKMATSWDGAWTSASGQSKWITSEEAREKAQELRRRVDAIVTSSKTIEVDDPRLTARQPDLSDASDQPLAIVLSSESQKFDLSPFKIAKHPGGVEVWNSPDPSQFLEQCYERKLFDVMLEAGPHLSQVFMEAGVVDEIWSFQESQFLGAGGLRFPTAFAGGALPGLRYSICELDPIGSSSILSILRPEGTE